MAATDRGISGARNQISGNFGDSRRRLVKQGGKWGLEEMSSTDGASPATGRGTALRLNAERRRLAAAKAASSSASPIPPAKKMNERRKSQKSPTPKKGIGEKDLQASGTHSNTDTTMQGGENNNDTASKGEDRLAKLEEIVGMMFKEKSEMKGEIDALRDRLEEVEWAKIALESRVKDLEGKLKEVEEGGGGVAGAMEEIKVVEKRLEKRLDDAERQGVGGGGGGGGDRGGGGGG